MVAEGKGYLVREATIMGADISEIVTIEPKSKVSFHQFDSPREGAIVNELIEGEEGLQLRFYRLLGLKNVEPDGPEEQRAPMQVGKL